MPCNHHAHHKLLNGTFSKYSFLNLVTQANTLAFPYLIILYQIFIHLSIGSIDFLFSIPPNLGLILSSTTLFLFYFINQLYHHIFGSYTKYITFIANCYHYYLFIKLNYVPVSCSSWSSNFIVIIICCQHI